MKHKATFDNSYARLPERFYTMVDPEPVASPELVRVNQELAHHLGFDPEQLGGAEGVGVLAGNAIFEGAQPLAAVYAGHQFGNWSPQLGDGRAVLLGEVVSEDKRFDIQLKGSGRTPYSRRGDGRSPLGPVLREYIISEAMHALGIPTTRSLAAVTTGEVVTRDSRFMGGVLTRVASSHIRVGTFEWFASQRDVEALEILSNHVMTRHYSDVELSDVVALDLLRAVSVRQAELVAKWQLVGFIHGVMNTDNVLVSGETIDYGPCAFMDAYDPRQVFSSIDTHGRYAYGNQPGIAQWNLARLAQALMPVLGRDDAMMAQIESVIVEFGEILTQGYRKGMANKIGLKTLRDDADLDLVDDLLALMHELELDYTVTFRGLIDPKQDAEPRLATWLARWQERSARESSTPAERRALMERMNPAIIPRNHLVEKAISAAYEGDFSPFHALTEALQTPWESNATAMALPPTKAERVRATFCGT